MGTVQQSTTCPVCQNEDAIDVFYYKTGECYQLCDVCGWAFESFFKKDSDGKYITKDGTDNYALDNLIMETTECATPYACMKVYSGRGHNIYSFDSKEDFDKSLETILEHAKSSTDGRDITCVEWSRYDPETKQIIKGTPFNKEEEKTEQEPPKHADAVAQEDA